MPFVLRTFVAFLLQRKNIIVKNLPALVWDLGKLKDSLNFPWFNLGLLTQFTSFLSLLFILFTFNAPQRWFAGAKEAFFPESTMFVKL